MNLFVKALLSYTAARHNEDKNTSKNFSILSSL